MPTAPLAVTVAVDLGKLLRVVPIVTEALTARAGRLIDDTLMREISDEIGPKIADLIKIAD